MNDFITQRKTEEAQRTTEKNAAPLCETFFFTRRTTEDTQRKPSVTLCEIFSVALCETFFYYTEEHGEPKRKPSVALCEIFSEIGRASCRERV